MSVSSRQATATTGKDISGPFTPTIWRISPRASITVGQLGEGSGGEK
ncbi:hypothetical protein NXF25_000143 [Crotalus adamanteus]|uniref:Uncharacterized protein n=1 Tax=Crotalus adamanteus TaxID=8729 RepID=A0AAW1C3R6_CROAD